MNLKESWKRICEIDQEIPERVAKNMPDDELKQLRDLIREKQRIVSNLVGILLLCTAGVTMICMVICDIFSIDIYEMTPLFMIVFLILGCCIPYGQNKAAKYTKMMEKRYYKDE